MRRLYLNNESLIDIDIRNPLQASNSHQDPKMTSMILIKFSKNGCPLKALFCWHPVSQAKNGSEDILRSKGTKKDYPNTKVIVDILIINISDLKSLSSPNFVDIYICLEISKFPQNQHSKVHSWKSEPSDLSAAIVK